MHRIISTCAVLAVLTLSLPTRAEDLPTAWAAHKLEATDGKKYDWKTIADEKKVLVVVITGNQCPIALGYHERLNELVETFGQKGVQVVCVNPLAGAGEQLEDMKTLVEENSKPKFVYLKDFDQKIAKSLGAKVTPEAFVLKRTDTSWELVYSGLIDDDTSGRKVKTTYLRDGIEAALAGKAPAVQKTLARGCSITPRK